MSLEYNSILDLMFYNDPNLMYRTISTITEPGPTTTAFDSGTMFVLKETEGRMKKSRQKLVEM